MYDTQLVPHFHALEVPERASFFFFRQIWSSSSISEGSPPGPTLAIYAGALENPSHDGDQVGLSLQTNDFPPNLSSLSCF